MANIASFLETRRLSMAERKGFWGSEKNQNHLLFT